MTKNYLFGLLIYSIWLHNTTLFPNTPHEIEQQKQQQKISMAAYFTQKANPLNWTIMNPYKDPEGFFITAVTLSVILVCSAHIYKKYKHTKTCTENISDIWKYIKSFVPKNQESEEQAMEAEARNRVLAHLQEQKTDK